MTRTAISGCCTLLRFTVVCWQILGPIHQGKAPMCVDHVSGLVCVSVCCCSSSASECRSSVTDAQARRPVPRRLRGVRPADQSAGARRVVTWPARGSRPLAVGADRQRARFAGDRLGHGARRRSLPLHRVQRGWTELGRLRTRHLRSLLCFNVIIFSAQLHIRLSVLAKCLACHICPESSI